MQRRVIGGDGLEVSALGLHLTAADLREIDQAASQIEVHGTRYPEHLLKMVGR